MEDELAEAKRLLSAAQTQIGRANAQNKNLLAEITQLKSELEIEAGLRNEATNEAARWESKNSNTADALAKLREEFTALKASLPKPEKKK